METTSVTTLVLCGGTVKQTVYGVAAYLAASAWKGKQRRRKYIADFLEGNFITKSGNYCGEPDGRPMRARTSCNSSIRRGSCESSKARRSDCSAPGRLLSWRRHSPRPAQANQSCGYCWITPFKDGHRFVAPAFLIQSERNLHVSICQILGHGFVMRRDLGGPQ